MKKLLALLFATLLCYSQTEAMQTPPISNSPLSQFSETFDSDNESSPSNSTQMTDDENSLQDFSDTDSTTSSNMEEDFPKDAIIHGELSVFIDSTGYSLIFNGKHADSQALSEFTYLDLETRVEDFFQRYPICSLQIRNIPSSYAKLFWKMLNKLFKNNVFDDVTSMITENANIELGLDSLTEISERNPLMAIQHKKTPIRQKVRQFQTNFQTIGK